MKMKILKLNSYPFIVSVNCMNLFLSFCYTFIFDFYDMLIIAILMMNSSLNKWWNKIMMESMKGLFLKMMKKYMKYSFVMFIMSEIMIFSSMFWMFFHSSISPNMEMGINWPPMSFVKTINPMSIPLSMSMILLMSSFTITLSHHFAMNNMIKMAKKNLSKTFIMGMMFFTLQMIEYSHSKNKISMSFNDSIYSNSFFMITSLHGSHVMGGSLFLLKSTKIFSKNSKKNMINFEMSIWYWHFVDLVWIFVFSFIYWWSMFLLKNYFPNNNS